MLEKIFKLKENNTNVKTEVTAGITTFMTMAYILAVNPSILGEAGMDPTGVLLATCIASFIGTVCMAFMANLPFALSAGMGLNAFLTYTVVQGFGYSWQVALLAVFVEGIVFIVLSLTKVREAIFDAIPFSLKNAVSVGIGLFIAFIGFQNVGIIQANQYTLVQFVKINGAKWADIAPAIIALLGFIIIAVLTKLNVKGSVLIGILATTVIYYLATWQLPSFDMGAIGQSFKDFGEIAFLGCFKAEAWKNAFSGEMIGSIFTVIMLIVTYCLVDMFDTIGTLYGAASEADMLDENGDPVDMNKSMTCDAVATTAGAVCGTSTVTTFVECASGVAAGGRTGLTSLVTSLCFAVCLFLAPFASVIPAAATAPALIYVGVLMLKNFSKVDMQDIGSAVPAFLTLIMMPMTYSIANGIGIGAIAYTVIALFTGNYKKKDIAVTIIALLFVGKFLFGAI